MMGGGECVSNSSVRGTVGEDLCESSCVGGWVGGWMVASSQHHDLVET